ncbi:uncharacterized protein [Primulina huaijiensis]|uniref:uncharacterized protein n=1 Tax=Primulina huaijiensis TaxID=1492673 RepID=UPI003CC7970C
MWGTYKCFRCGGNGHKVADFPKQKQPVTRRTYVMHAEQAEPDTTLIRGRMLLAGIATYSLLDSGATHSFIFGFFVKRLEILLEDVESGFRVTVPSGEHMVSTSMVKDVELKLQRNFIRADLIVLPMAEFDIILGMDWLTLNGATIDFQQIIIYVPDTDSRSIEDVEVVKDFLDVFPDDVSAIPPEREVEFAVELIPGSMPIYKAPYRLAPAEMKELNDQIQELLYKGSIRPSLSSWRAPVLFAKKRTGV